MITAGMRFKLDVVVSHTADLPDENSVRHLVDAVLDGEHIRWASIGIILADHAIVTELNKTWLSHDYDTDVLSFVVDHTPEGLEGEVYVDTETARERHAEFQTSVTTEVMRYIVHGLLHLAGHDDQTAEGARLMRALEDRYLMPAGTGS